MSTIILLSLYPFSVLYSIAKMSNSFTGTLNRMGELGLKVKEGNSDRVINYLDKKSKINITKKDALKLLVPGYNIYYATQYKTKKMDETIKVLEENEALEKFDQEDYKSYDSLSDAQSKIQYIINNASFISYMVNGYDEDKREINESKYIEKRDIREGLMEDYYDIDEVEVLADSYRYGYRIGYCDSKPVAIIGVYDSDLRFDYIKTDSDEFHEYKLISRKEAEGLKFKVYKFMEPYDEKRFERSLSYIQETRKMIEKISSNTNMINNVKVKKIAR